MKDTLLAIPAALLIVAVIWLTIWMLSEMAV